MSTTPPASPSPVFAVARVDPELMATLKNYGTLTDFDNTHIYPSVQDAVAAFRASPK